MNFGQPLDSVLGSESKVRILRFLSRNVKPTSARQIAIAVGMGETPVGRSLRDLVESGLVCSEPVGKSFIYWLNRVHVLAQPLRSLFENEGNVRQGMISFVLADLIDDVLAAIIYGSVAREEESAGSDLDLFLIVSPSSLDKVSSLLECRRHEFYRRFGKPLSTVVYTPEQIASDRGDKVFFREALRTGWIAYGQVPGEIIRALKVVPRRSGLWSYFPKRESDAEAVVGTG